MKPPIFLTILLPSAICLAQSPDAPKFEIADVHLSAKTTNAFPQTSPARNGRYQIKTASMVDLISIAYGFAADKVLGGPNWIEMDRFDVIAKLPPDSTPETQKLMLQSLLEDRFKLVVRKETKPLPTYALVAGKKPQLKTAEGTEETGCKPKTSTGGPPGENSIRLFTSNADGATTTIDLGPGMTIQFMCRNITMAQFAGGVRGMMGGAAVGTNQVLDETGLKGVWNFDVKWSWQLNGPFMASGSLLRVKKVEL
jgi:uncharacterized protein (TIGR03435 family)